MKEFNNILSVIKELERLKNNTRTAWTSTGRQESIAEHSWRLSLFSMILVDYFPEMDRMKVICMSLIHDLGEAFDGDISAKAVVNTDGKMEKEEKAMIKLIEPLPEKMRHRLLSLWWEYNKGETKEAQLVKALDKIETIIQHNQGNNPPDFDYQFNLDYGKKYSYIDPIIESIRELVDKETMGKIQGS
ncbi:HD domain-containing protein [Bacillus sp. FJAT-49736]|uniref:HD domain-containing protein n=1 Tax=Bacillus sp. FJAT-49736 TaxID=2833582 RepID=UPI001BC8D4FC|nr:HD domain-containing protein [Bacillus sp. FJAT-49736]MBS4174503.1 HD domain-containing protein [Bacillus sp. FJAT-49736]